LGLDLFRGGCCCAMALFGAVSEASSLTDASSVFLCPIPSGSCVEDTESNGRFTAVGRGSLGEGRGCVEEKKEYASRGLATGVLKNFPTAGVDESWSGSRYLVQFESMWSLIVACLTGLPQIGHATIIGFACFCQDSRADSDENFSSYMVQCLCQEWVNSNVGFHN
jgi:hypothetical protein